jgi:hypothetical protein
MNCCAGSKSGKMPVERAPAVLRLPTTLAPSYGMYPAVDEVVDFLGCGATAAEIATFNLSPAARTRARDLLIKNQDDSLTEEDARELEVYGELEEFMALLKIRALQRLQNDPCSGTI